MRDSTNDRLYFYKFDRKPREWTTEDLYDLYERAKERKVRFKSEYEEIIKEIITTIPPTNKSDIQPEWELFSLYFGNLKRISISTSNDIADGRLFYNASFEEVEPSRESNLDSLLTEEDSKESKLLQKFLMYKHAIYTKLEDRVHYNMLQIIMKKLHTKFDEPTKEIFSVRMKDGCELVFERQWNGLRFLGINNQEISYEELE